MNRHLIKVLFACASIAPVVAWAQGAPPAKIAPGSTAGIPTGATRLQNQNSKGFPAPQTTAGQPIETRTPEKADDKPAFAGQTRAPFQPTTPINVTVMTDQLKNPWSLAFLPDGGMLITEKGGNLRIFKDGKLSDPISGLPKIQVGGQVGLLDVALDNKFASNHRIFFSYMEPADATHSNIAIARAKLDGNALSDVMVIFRANPAILTRVAANSGGRLAIAKDDTIFATIGDRSSSPPWDVAQQLDTDLGKMIHITADGKAAPGNPFIGQKGALPEIYSIGHRSEEGLAFDNKGRLWENENGPRGGDELNLIEKGKNYGWPLYTHGLDYPGEPIGEGAVTAKGTVQPRYYWDPVIAPSGMTFYHGNLFPAWKNSVFVGALRGQMLDRLSLDANDKVVGEEPLLVDQKNRIRDVRVGPDGAVYVLADEGKLFKLTPK